MNEGLEALKRIQCNYVSVFRARENGKTQLVHDLNTIKKELKRLEELDNGAYVSIHINKYNELCDKEEALEIIKNKGLDVYRLLTTENVEQYNHLKYRRYEDLIQEEYDLLKEVLL